MQYNNGLKFSFSLNKSPTQIQPSDKSYHKANPCLTLMKASKEDSHFKPCINQFIRKSKSNKFLQKYTNFTLANTNDKYEGDSKSIKSIQSNKSRKYYRNTDNLQQIHALKHKFTKSNIKEYHQFEQKQYNPSKSQAKVNRQLFPKSQHSKIATTTSPHQISHKQPNIYPFKRQIIQINSLQNKTYASPQEPPTILKTRLTINLSLILIIKMIILQLYSQFPIILLMKSNSTKHRTASTAVMSKTQLPKIPSTNHESHLQIDAINRKLFTNNKSTLLQSNMKNKDRIKTEVNATSRGNTFALRNIKGENSGYKKFQEQLKEVNGLFKKIQKLRQNYGIVSINEKGEEEQRNDFHQIPYDPYLHEMNEQICQIKSQIEQSFQRLFRISKQYPRLKHMIESLLEQHLHDFLLQNGRTGKIAAMKAHHRLIQSSQQKIARLFKY